MHWQRASQWREKNAGTVGFANVIDCKYATRSSHAFFAYIRKSKSFAESNVANFLSISDYDRFCQKASWET